jgi:putative ABC transport system permease protein
MIRDIRNSLRLLVKQPSFSLVALAAIAIGIGSNTAMFSVVYGVLLKPLPFHEPDKLVVVLERNMESGSTRPVAPANFTDVRQSNHVFQDVGAAEMWSAALTGSDVPERITGLRMSASVFDVLGTKPLLGRVIRAEEETNGRHRVVVLSHRLWQRRFGGDPHITGRTVLLSGEPFEVIGVMPASFRFPPFWAPRAEMYVPLSWSDARRTSRTGQSLRLFARLRSGRTVPQAQAEMDTIAARLTAAYPDTNAKAGIWVAPLHEMVAGKVKPVLLVLFAAVGFVLLIACANVANLLLARSVGRRKEIAVRFALGAGRARVVRQLLTENLILSLAGGLIGLLLAYWGVAAIQAAFSDDRVQNQLQLPRLEEVGIQPEILFFTTAASLLTGLLFGLLPAWHAARSALSEDLKEGARSVQGTRGGARMRDLLVVGEVALTLMLLVGAALMARSFLRLIQIDPGFRPENKLTALVNVHGTSAGTGERQVAFYREMLGRLGALPGVKAAVAVNHLPLSGDTWSTNFVLDDRPFPAPGDEFNAVFRFISPGYFQAIGGRILRGREFADSDVNGTQPVAVINQNLANLYWPGQEAIGKRLRADDDGPWLTIVGVVSNIKQRDWANEPRPEIYMPYLQHPDFFANSWSSAMSIVLTTWGDPLSVRRALEETVWSMDRSIAVAEVLTLDEIVSDAVRQPRAYAALMGIFAVAALVLATVGLYGVISYAVAERTREMGVRAALGAAPADLLRLVAGKGMKLVVAGLLIGTACALSLSRLLSGILYGVKPTDAVSFALVLILISAVALIAICVPARRAMRLDPLTALRCE